MKDILKEFASLSADINALFRLLESGTFINEGNGIRLSDYVEYMDLREWVSKENIGG